MRPSGRNNVENKGQRAEDVHMKRKVVGQMWTTGLRDQTMDGRLEL